jgi:hypothetical protein
LGPPAAGAQRLDPIIYTLKFPAPDTHVADVVATFGRSNRRSSVPLVLARFRGRVGVRVMLLYVTHGSQIGVVGRSHTVPMGAVSLMRGGLMVAGNRGRLCCSVMLRGEIEMVRGAAMMLFHILRHCFLRTFVSMRVGLAA